MISISTDFFSVELMSLVLAVNWFADTALLMARAIKLTLEKKARKDWRFHTGSLVNRLVVLEANGKFGLQMIMILSSIATVFITK